jgi:hypothetical protein
MRTKIFQTVLLVVCLTFALQSGFGKVQTGSADEKKYGGTWSGSYSSNEGAGGSLTFVLSRDEKGQWRGALKFTNQDGEQKADMKSPQIADGKFKTTIEAPGGEVDVIIEGTFQGDKLEGTYVVTAKGSSEVAEKGTWKVTRTQPTMK